MRVSLTPPLEASAYPFAHPVRVRFAETDAMGVVHHAAYLPYLEEARVALLAAHGHPYEAVRAAGTDLAVIEVHCRYRRPLRFGDVATVHVGLGVATSSTVQIGYLVTGPEGASLTAVTVHACLDGTTGRPQRVPAWLGDFATAAAILHGRD